MGKRNRRRNKKNGSSNDGKVKVSLNIKVNTPCENSDNTLVNMRNTTSVNADFFDALDTLNDEPIQTTRSLLAKTLSKPSIKKLEVYETSDSDESFYFEPNRNSWISVKEKESFQNLSLGYDDKNTSAIVSFAKDARPKTLSKSLIKDFGVYDDSESEETFFEPDRNSWISTRENKSFQNLCLGYDDKDTSATVSFVRGAKPKTKSGTYGNPASNNKAGWKINIEITKTFGECMTRDLRSYEENWVKFRSLYLSWKNQRQNSIRKLQELAEEVHKDQLAFNKTNVMFKEMNIGSRTLKSENVSTTVDFFASLATFLTDAAGGITSAAQAINADGYINTFKGIMEHDAEITNPLYTARSQCLEQYRDVEEVVRRFHSDTFGETMESLNKTLRTEDLWLELKNAHVKGETWKIIEGLDKYFTRSSRADVMQNAYRSIQSYVNSNPAALEACKSAGKAIYDVFDTWGPDSSKRGRASLTGNMSVVANTMLLHEERNELYKLKSITDNEVGPQAKLESDINDAIYSLQSELREIDSIFKDVEEAYGNW